jgi:serine/threonine protein kinase
MSTPKLAPDSVLAGKYRLFEAIGAGGMGVVYRAEQIALGRTVAIKMLRPDHAASAERVRRFHAEARAASRLCHRGSVALYDYGIADDGAPFLVMEYVDGIPLSDYLRDRWPVPLGLVVDLGLQILAAIADAHAAGVIHADIKSDNVLIETRRGGTVRAKIVDYGLARLVDDTPEPAYGTPEYVAPEVACGQPISIAADIYSIGITLYELLTGAPPFGGATTEEILDRQVADVVVPPSSRQPSRGITPGLEAVVMKALSKRPDQRYASARAFATALERARPVQANAPTRCSCGAILPLHSIACVYCGELRRTLANSGLTRASTSELRLEAERASKLARGTRSEVPLDEKLRALRLDIGDAIVRGNVHDIASGYLELAGTVAAYIGPSAAASELVEAVNVLTQGDGPRSLGTPHTMWRVLGELARYHELSGDRARARNAAENARLQAIAAGSLAGQTHATLLLDRLR